MYDALRVGGILPHQRIESRVDDYSGVRKGVYRENPACEGNPFRVDVRTYTLFGVPWGEADLPRDM